jgi:cytoskeletal protein RodZ
MKINTKQKPKTKVIIITIGALVILALLYLAVAFKSHYPPFAVQEKINKTNEQTVNLERSDAEKQKSQELEDNPDAKTENNQTDTPDAPTQTTPSGKQSVNVLITNASITNNNVKASGFVTNLVQEGGECTYVFTSGSATITKKSGTLVNSTSTTCETVTFGSSELPVSGTWKVVLTYSSADAEGTSSAREFTK